MAIAATTLPSLASTRGTLEKIAIRQDTSAALFRSGAEQTRERYPVATVPTAA